MLLAWSECADYPLGSWNTVVVWTWNFLVTVRFPLYNHGSLPTLAFHIYLSISTLSWSCNLVMHHHFTSWGLFPKIEKKIMDQVSGNSFLSSTHPCRSGLWALGHIFLRISYLLIPQTLIIIICSPCVSILWHDMFRNSSNHSDLGERQPGKLRCFLSAGVSWCCMVIIRCLFVPLGKGSREPKLKQWCRM